MRPKLKVYGVSVAIFLAFLFAIVPIAAAAGLITLTPTSQTPGGAVSVSGTGFGATKVVGIGFGAEANVISEAVTATGPYDVDVGPYVYPVSYRPVKPGSFQMDSGYMAGGSYIPTFLYWDNGNGTISTNNTAVTSAAIDYVTGKVSFNFTAPLSSSVTYLRTAKYTHYQYNVTPVAGVTTSASGAFAANIVVPSVASGNYVVTAIDSAGNRAASSLNVGVSSSGWSKTYGGAGNDIGTGNTVQTTDGGYAVSGDTSSFGAGGTDFWLFKTDASGNMLWNKTCGGTGAETCGDMCQTSDGGYALAGNTASFGAGGLDVYLVKTDATGNMQWNKTYGGTGSEYALHVIQTGDGGYAMTGYTTSFGAGSYDVWLVKTDASGNLQWNKTYGGNGTEIGYGVFQTGDGGYVVGGYTNSFGAGGNDVWLFKTDATGNMIWNKTYGGTGSDYGYDMIHCSDGGYAMVGYSTSFGGTQAYLVKTDASGNLQWNKTYGGDSSQMGLHGIQTADGGYAIVGWTYANGQDFLLIKADAAGNMQWQTTYGGTGVENGYALLQSSDGSYVLTGTTNSFGAGGNDAWLVKTDAAGMIPEFSSWLIPLLGLAATGFMVIGKKRLFRTR